MQYRIVAFFTARAVIDRIPQACPNAMRAPAARLKIPISSEHPRILQIPSPVQDACPAAR